MTIDFEKDQEEVLDKTTNINKLADKIKELQAHQKQLEVQEDSIKQKKKDIELLSGEVIPTMLSEMGLSYLKLQDGSSIEVKTNYSATITQANKENAFKWLRENGLGDIIKNEISVSFGRNEDNKAADYAELAKGQGLEPQQKLKVEPMTLKALVRERIEAGKEMPTELFNVFIGNKDNNKKETITMSEVQEKKKNEISTNLFEADAGQGLNMTQEDLALPFLKVLGQLSPECNKRDAKHVEGAEPGMIINTVTGEVYDGVKGIDVVPVHYKRQHIEWQDRGESQGAPVKIYDAGDDLPSTTRDKFNKDRLANGNYLENTASHFVVILGDSPTTALLSMKATQLKVSRKWNSMMMGLKMQGKNGMFTPPTYSHIYKLKTVQQSNDKGTWFGWDVSRVGPISDPGIYKIAKDFGANVSKGDVKVKHGEQESKSDSPY
jgi:hypothetical protein